MKTLILVIAACTMGGYVSAQKMAENQVPAIISKNFKAKFPAAKDVKWEKEADDFEANFEINKVETSALYDAKGNLKEIESEIEKSDLPKAVSETLARDFKNYKIEETSKIEKNGVITYEAEVEKGEKSIDLFFDANGKFLREIPNEKKD